MRPHPTPIVLFLGAFLVLVASPARAQGCPPPLGDAPDALRTRYRPVRVLSYDEGRDTLYARWAGARGGTIRTVYSGIEVPLTEGDPTQVLYRQGVNTEHSWPRSRGSDGWPAEADLHLLFPSDERTNSRRGNLPYGEVPDEQVQTWAVNGEVFPGPPPHDTAYVSRIGRDAFEPPDAVKGDLARAHLYFALMYPGNADADFFEGELSDLLEWNRLDPPSREEVQRDSVIQTIQGNCNPFVRWPELALAWLGDAGTVGVCREVRELFAPYGMALVWEEGEGTCELTATGWSGYVLERGDPADAVRVWLTDRGWREDLSRSADGPGTTSFAYTRAGEVCEVSGGAPSSLEDGEIVVAERYELQVACLSQADPARRD